MLHPFTPPFPLPSLSPSAAKPPPPQSIASSSLSPSHPSSHRKLPHSIQEHQHLLTTNSSPQLLLSIILTLRTQFPRANDLFANDMSRRRPAAASLEACVLVMAVVVRGCVIAHFSLLERGVGEEEVCLLFGEERGWAWRYKTFIDFWRRDDDVCDDG